MISRYDLFDTLQKSAKQATELHQTLTHLQSAVDCSPFIQSLAATAINQSVESASEMAERLNFMVETLEPSEQPCNSPKPQ